MNVFYVYQVYGHLLYSVLLLTLLLSVCYGKSGHFYFVLSVLLCSLVIVLTLLQTIANGLHVAIYFPFHMAITEIIGFGNLDCQ